MRSLTNFSHILIVIHVHPFDRYYDVTKACYTTFVNGTNMYVYIIFHTIVSEKDCSIFLNPLSLYFSRPIFRALIFLLSRQMLLFECEGYVIDLNYNFLFLKIELNRAQKSRSSFFYLCNWMSPAPKLVFAISSSMAFSSMSISGPQKT